MTLAPSKGRNPDRPAPCALSSARRVVAAVRPAIRRVIGKAFPAMCFSCHTDREKFTSLEVDF